MAMYIYIYILRNEAIPRYTLYLLPYWVILKGVLPYPELREKVKYEFSDFFRVWPPEDPFEDQEWSSEIKDD